MGVSTLFLIAAAATASPTGSTIRASAEAMATLRILTPALIGAGRPAPRPHMVARDTMIALPDGRSAPLRLYEFE